MIRKNRQSIKWPLASPMPTAIVPVLFFIPLNCEVDMKQQNFIAYLQATKTLIRFLLGLHHALIFCIVQ
ncbi:MAG: hypothetical protein CMF39_02120 [Legionellaceae bacterium]|nr:hypothetical protein [Legionellaceae bacterium]